MERTGDRPHEIVDLYERVARDVVYRVVLHPRPHLAYLGPGIRQLTGHPREAFYQDPELAFRLLHADDRIHVSGLDPADPPPLLTIRLHLPDGSLRVTEHRLRCVREGSRVVALEGAARDVDEPARQRDRARRLVRLRAALQALTREFLEGELDARFYQHVLDRAVELVPGAQAASLTRRTPRGTFAFAAVAGFGSDVVGLELSEEELLRDTSSRRPAILRGYPPHTLEPETHAILFGPSGRTDDIAATLSLPVFVHGRAEAFLNLDNFDDRDAFDEEALEIADLFGQQISAMLHRVVAEEALTREAYLDPLTGLPNRRLAADRLAVALRRAQRDGSAVAVLFVDLDNFKTVNDGRGHEVGDALLREAARRLDEGTRDADTVARWSGDEFMVVLTDLRHPGDADRRAQALLARLRGPYAVGGANLHASASIGYTVYPWDDGDAQQLLGHADMALLHAKRSGKDAAAAYRGEMGTDARRWLEVSRALREVVDRGHGLALHYQPRVSLRDGSITSVEALARWHHAELGAVPPIEFIAVAEESGLIGPLGDAILHLACRQIRRWLDAGTPRVVAVNLSARQLREPDLVDRVARSLADQGVDGRLLELEITESAAMTDIDDSVRKLRGLRALGVALSIDDFGTAYSSLAYLQRLPVDAIKIDRSFLQALGPEPDPDVREAAIVAAIVALGHALGVRLIAEGVETEGQRRFLVDLGCDEAQGYHLGRPAPAPALD